MEVWKEALREVCSMAVLLWLAIQDKRHLGISRLQLWIGAGILLFAGSFCECSRQVRLGGAAFGAVLFAFIYFSKEALGVADGIVITACGIAFGLYEVVVLCFFASLYAGGYAVVLLLTKKAGRKSRIPFLPFLLLGYVTLRMGQRFL